MRLVVETHEYKRCLRRTGKRGYSRIVDEELPKVIDALANDEVLPASYKDHELHHNWEGSRECHIRPDLLLVYEYVGYDVLKLQRLGSHSEIFGL